MARLGFYYFPDDLHYTRQDLAAWLPVLQELGAGWLTLRGTPRRAVPEPFVRGLLQAGIEPIIHIPAPLGSLNLGAMAPLLAAYAHWGLRYVILYDRPNLRANWPPGAWARQGLVERFVDALLPLLRLQQEVGLAPVFPPLEPAGDYWDLAFLEGALLALQRRGERPLLRDLHLSLYAWTYGRPLDWGAGGPRRWEQVQPYRQDPASQDHRGLRIYEWYQAVASQSDGIIKPLLVVAGGCSPGFCGEDPHLAMSQNLAIAAEITENKLPPYLLNFNFYLLSAPAGHPDQEAAWYLAPDQPAPIVELLPRDQAEPKAASTAAARVIRHYVLLPEGRSPAPGDEWHALSHLMEQEHPTLGYSLLEARTAMMVTLVGTPEDYPENVERLLLDAGCQVRWLLDQEHRPTAEAFPRTDPRIRSKP
jgi:hypothetical protein